MKKSSPSGRRSTAKTTKAKKRPTSSPDIHIATEEDAATSKTSPIALTEVYASERLAEYLQGRYCFSPALGWLQWFRRQRWREVSEDVVVEVARKRHKIWYASRLGAAIANDNGEVGPLRRLLSKNGVAAVVALCRGQLHVDSELFDADPDLLNTPTGVVDLRTGDLRPGQPEDCMTKITAVGYVAGATHKDWNAVLRAVRPDAREYLQIRAGQSITGHQPDDDVVLFLKGGGENGKSTYIGGFTTPLGSYYRQVSDKVLLADAKSHTTELTDLRGLRVAAIEELPEGRYLNAVLLKKITGQEITARRIRKDDMTFTTQHAMLVTSNYNTQVGETDWGTWRRLQRLVFPYTYVAPGKRRRRGQRRGDAGLRDRVRTDSRVQEAALAWAVEGAVRWYEGGRAMPPPPNSVRRDTDAWRAESDLVFKYWREHLSPSVDRYVMSTELRLHFNEWLKGDGHQTWSAQKFTERFGGHDLTRQHKVVGPKQQKKPTDALSRPREIPVSGGDGGVVEPVNGFKAWFGIQFVSEAEDL